MNKIASTLISAALYMFSITPSHAVAILDISPSIQSVGISSPVSFAVTLSGLDANTALSVYDLDIGFDPTLLSFSQVTFGDPLLGDQLDLLNLGLNGPTATAGLGLINLIEFSLDDTAALLAQQADSFTLAILSFNTLTAGTSPITLSVNGLTDTNAADIPYTVRNGAIVIGGDPSTNTVPEPEALLLLLSGSLAFLLNPRRNRFL
ncbi:hypothetical protein [Methylomonas albis]|uniref:PEP-CTERM protein-sorting domain-containing protein n=1 Tax=Methylomonas albis TaxID=1854563 RepID=A0ABR9CWD8_9GAMM|nr:hypothetical protein [Methylomonas albis]MBD9355186.1 hypothetical protein [Methylomonas albis]